MAGGAGVDDGGEVASEIVTVAAGAKGHGEGEFHGDLGRANELTVLPGLAVNGDFMLGGDGVQEGLAIARKYGTKSTHAGHQVDALFIGDRELVNSGVFSHPRRANQVLAAG